MRVQGFIGIIALAGLLAGGAQAGVVYNAVSDFSGSQNPNGVWSYRDGSGNLLSNPSTGPGGIPQWDNGSSYPTGSYISANTSSTGITSGTVYVAAHTMHLDGQGVGAETRFTAAATGTFDVSGQFSYGDTSMVTHTVSIVDNLGNTLFSTLLANGQTKSFSLAAVSLVAGGWLDFVTGTDGGASYAGTNLQATISSPVPVPPTLSLLGIGVVVELLRQRKGRPQA